MIKKNLYIGVIAGVGLLFLFGYTYNWWHRRKERQDAARESQINQLDKDQKALVGKDTMTRHHLDSINLHVDSVSRHSGTLIEHWDTVTKKVPVYIKVTVPGKAGRIDTVTKIDSVFKDARFAALPDSDKVKVLRTLGNENNRVCTELRTSCQAARDSAKAALALKDDQIKNRSNAAALWEQRFNDKPRRRCGLGGSIGYGAIVHSGSVLVGPGASLGYSCSF